jgi:transposase InsO family protein
MGSKGDCYDNAVCESFHATLEKELLRSRSFKTRQEAKTAIFDWSNPSRRSSSSSASASAPGHAQKFAVFPRSARRASPV